MAGEQLPEIRRARLGTLTIYEISEAELETLERGLPASLFLNFSVFLVSVAVSFSITLATTAIASNRTFQVFVIVTILGYLTGLVLFAMWWISYKSTANITRIIRERLLPESEQIVVSQYMPAFNSLEAQCFDRIERRGPPRRVQSESDPDG